MSSESVIEMLKVHFPSPEFVFLEEVRNGTGYARGHIRTADAIIMGTYPSRGLYMHGVEVKISRQDWLNEFQLPPPKGGGL